jgi:hypothetical protein
MAVVLPMRALKTVGATVLIKVICYQITKPG